MANYKTHSVFNLCCALPALVAAAYYYIYPPYVLLVTFVITFVYCTLFMNPDLDLAHKIRLFSLRGILTLPFRLYSVIFSHRGISHSLLFGSLTRIGWLAGMSLLVFYLLHQTLPASRDFYAYYRMYKYYIWYGAAGVCLADWSHLLLDIKIRK